MPWPPMLWEVLGALIVVLLTFLGPTLIFFALLSLVAWSLEKWPG